MSTLRRRQDPRRRCRWPREDGMTLWIYHRPHDSGNRYKCSWDGDISACRPSWQDRYRDRQCCWLQCDEYPRDTRYLCVHRTTSVPREFVYRSPHGSRSTRGTPYPCSCLDAKPTGASRWTPPCDYIYPLRRISHNQGTWVGVLLLCEFSEHLLRVSRGLHIPPFLEECACMLSSSTS